MTACRWCIRFSPLNGARRRLAPILFSITFASRKRPGLDYVYLGYWVPGSPKMDYKSRFSALEVYRGGEWQPIDRDQDYQGWHASPIDRSDCRTSGTDQSARHRPGEGLAPHRTLLFYSTQTCITKPSRIPNSAVGRPASEVKVSLASSI